MKKIDYSFKSYREIFVKLFEKEKERILAVLGGADVRIEHIGSTAVPGLGGKGIIDIIVAAEKEKLDQVRAILEELGYEFDADSSMEERLFFRNELSDDLEGVRRYHLHLTFFESGDWFKALAFRDHLLKDASAKKEYADIKKQAAAQVGQNGLKYKKFKEPFILKILKNA